MGQMHAQQRVVVGAAAQRLDHAGGTVDRHGPPVDVTRITYSTPDDRAGVEIAEHRVPIEWRPMGKAQRESAVGRESIGRAAAGAKLARRCVEHVVRRPC